MPLQKGSSKEVIGENMMEMMQSGHSQKQAIAAALDTARKSKGSYGVGKKKARRK